MSSRAVRRWLRCACAALGAALAGAGAGACSSSAPLPGGQAGASGGATMLTGSGGGAIVPTSARDAATDVAIGPGAPDANPPLPVGLLAELPPDVACSGEIDAAVACDLPASTCALAGGCDADVTTCMQGSTWIVYYEHPRCLAGRCVWDQEYFPCDSGSRCIEGACISILSTT